MSTTDGKKNKAMTAEELKKFLPEFFARDAKAPFPMTVFDGNMAPFLTGGRDTAILTKFNGKSERGDILLVDCGGRVTLSRVFAENGCEMSLMGDSQAEPCSAVGRAAVLARCDSVVKDGRLIRKNDAVWRFFERVWAEKPEARKQLLQAAGVLDKKL